MNHAFNIGSDNTINLVGRAVVRGWPGFMGVECFGLVGGSTNICIMVVRNCWQNKMTHTSCIAWGVSVSNVPRVSVLISSVHVPHALVRIWMGIVIVWNIVNQTFQ